MAPKKSLKNKGTCLFCLKGEIARIQYEDSMESDHKSPEFGSAPGFKKIEETSGKLFLLHNISRFLKIDYTQIFSKSLEVEENNIFAALCKECSVIADQFQDLHRNYEHAKLRLSYCVKTIYDKMNEAQKDTVVLDEYYRKVFNGEPEEEIEKCKWRELVLEKLFRKINEDLPRVEIPERALVNATNSYPASSFTRSKSIPDFINSETTFKTDLPTKVNRETSGKGGQKSCSYCGVVIFSYNKYKYRRHLIRNHCETFFCELKNSSLTEIQFKKIVDHFLFDHIKKTRTCPNCSKAFVATKDREHTIKLKLHLIDEHFDELENKLKSIQKDANLVKKLMQVRLKKPCKLPTETKPICKTKKPCQQSEIGLKEEAVEDNMYQEHDQDPFQSFITEKLNDDSKVTPELVTTQNKTNDHVAPLQEEENLFDDAWDNAFDDGEGSGDDTGISVKADGGDEIPLDFQLTTEPRKSLSTTSESSRQPKTEIIEGSKQNTKNRQKSCPHCNVPILAFRKYKYRRHLLRHHSETFFESLKEPHVSVDQFKKIVTHLVFQGKKVKTCPYCSASYDSKMDKEFSITLKCHLMDEHFEKLKEKLKKIQTDPDLPEKLEAFSSQKSRKKRILVRARKEKEIDNGMVPTICDICGKSVLFRNLKHHKLTHEDDTVKKEATCEHCGGKLKDTSMKLHRIYVCPKGPRIKKRPKIICEACGKCLSSRGLKKHRLYHCKSKVN